MGSNSENSVYIHGYSEEEQKRLYKQAEFLEHIIYRDVNFSYVEDVLEVGCGVGAQTQILLRRFPHLRITCIDLNDRQLQAARDHLETLDFAKNRYEIIKMNAANLAFSDGSFAAAFFCWVLEHMPDPKSVLSEVRRVLKPNAKVFLTEPMNFAFFLDPYCPAIWKFWMTYNDYQYERGGDPFIGVKLPTLLRDAGFVDVNTEMKTFYADKREPELRERVILYWQDLILSAATELINAGRIDKDLVLEAKNEFSEILKNPNAIFFDSFMQASARVPQTASNSTRG